MVEDEADIAEVLQYNLELEGFEVDCATRGDDALDAIRRSAPDLILLDLMLPGVNGVELTQILKRDEDTAGIPLIMVTARGDEMDRIVGLELGADDYMAKPFSPRELVARVNAQFRRREMDTAPPPQLDLPDGIKVDLARLEVHRDDQIVPLTPREGDILEYLVRNRNRVVTREDLLLDVWHYRNANVETRTVDIHIVGLRRKVEPDPANPTLIQTVRGKGYRWFS